MALNISKTKVIYISSRHKQHIINTSDTDICYKNSTVSGNPNVEVTLTNKYSLLGYSYWKCSQKLQLIPFYVIQNENVHEYYKRKLFFNSYSITHLDYCSIIWGNYSDSSEDELFKFQKGLLWSFLIKTRLQNILLNHIGWLSLNVFSFK